MCKCRGCGAILPMEWTSEETSVPTVSDMAEAGLPEDCSDAIPVVVLEAYNECSLDPWSDEDIGRWKWPAHLDVGAP